MDKLLKDFENSKTGLQNIVNHYSGIMYRFAEQSSKIFDENIKNKLKEGLKKK